MNINTPWRTFSIFISSTFADMQAERDHLKNIVFPRIEEELRNKRIRLETVDLRWGVDTTSVNEDEREATVLKVCLEEIDRCKPFFIGLLGDRYGWVPPEERIENVTIGRKLLLPNKNKSVTALEIEFGVLSSTEQLNRSVFYLREPLPYDKLSPEKAAKFSDQYDPTFSQEEKRTLGEALDNLKEAIKSHFRKINLPGKIKSYSVSWNNDQEAIVYGLEQWGEMVFNDILAECKRHAEDTWGEASKDQHEQELALLEAFIEEHTHITTTYTEKCEEQVHSFCGRKKLIEELREYLLSNDKGKWGLVLTGESGSGKSAVFSMMYKTMMKEDCLVLAHSAGISPGAKSVAELLRKWNRQLREFLGIKYEKEEQEQEIRGFNEQHLLTGFVQKTGPRLEIEKLQERFVELLLQASEKKRVILLIDAYDSFEPSQRAEYMTWIPESLSKNVKVLVTTKTGTEKNAVQYHKGLITKSIDNFTEEEAREMLHSLGKKQHKRLPKAVEKEILEREREDGLKAYSSPLWISLAVNILMAMDADDFEKMSGLKGKGDEQIESYMLDMVKQFPALPGDLFLDLIGKARRIFGGSFTTTLFNFIACSRGGLRESDLEMLLPKQTMQDWDPLSFASLRRWFGAHLIEQGEGHQWNLVHSIMRITLKDNMEPENFKNTHILISTHLLSLSVTDALRTSETMYHLLQPDNKIPAVEYYTSELRDESLVSATKIISETITSGEEGLETVSSFPFLVSDKEDSIIILLERFLYSLNNLLLEEGKLNQRLRLFNTFREALEKYFGNQTITLDLEYKKAVLYERLGDIHHSMGHMEGALKYFDNYNQLIKELYEVNPLSELLKDGLAISYEKLGEIYKAMGQLEEALKYFENYNQLEKELYEANPLSELLKHNLAFSYETLGTTLQAMGYMEEALKYFVNYNQLEKELYEANPRSEKIKSDFAITYLNLGDIQKEMGHMEEALKYFEKRSTLGKELYESNPRNIWLKNGLAISYERLGSTHHSMGHMDEALRYFEDYNQLTKELYEVNPLIELLKDSFAISYHRLGEIHQAMGHMDEALKYFENYNQLIKELYDANPLNESLKHGLAISCERLGSAHQAMGHMKEALKFFGNNTQLIKELYEANPRSENLKNDFAISYEKLGSVHQAMGHIEEALKYFEQFYQLIKELYEANPRSERIKDDFAISYERLGSVHQAMGHMEEALKYFERYCQLTKELYEANPRSENVKSGFAISYFKLADIHRAMGHMEEALRYFENCNQLIKELYEANPRSEKIKNDFAISYERIGFVHQAMGHMDEALKYFENYNQLIKELYDANPLSEPLKHGLAISYEELGSVHQAIGHMEEALKNYKEGFKLAKVFYESNPQNIGLLEGLGISYYNIAIIYKEIGKNDLGKENFSQWKNIISILAKNYPQVQKYKDWDNLEY